MKKIKHTVSVIGQWIKKWWDNLGTARKVILVIASGLLAIVTGINQIMELCDRFSGERGLGAKSHPQTISTNETGFVSSKPFEIFNPTNEPNIATGDIESLHFIVKKMTIAHQRGDSEEAVGFAKTAETLLSKCDTHNPSVISDHVAIKSCLMEESFYNGDYDKTIELHKELQTLGGGRYVATRPCYMALESVANLLKSGKTIFFFSPSELGALSKWDKTTLEEYLSYLAAWGYLQPLMIDPWIKRHGTFYYEDFFGLSKPLPYQHVYMLTAFLTNGVELTSNEMSARWAGRKKFIPVDIDRCALDELNLANEENLRKPLTMTLCFNEEHPEKVSINLDKDKSLPLSPTTEISVKIRSAWNPEISQTTTHTRRIAEIRSVAATNRIPVQIWIIMLALVCMAFASPISPDGKATPRDSR